MPTKSSQKLPKFLKFPVGTRPCLSKYSTRSQLAAIGCLDPISKLLFTGLHFQYSFIPRAQIVAARYQLSRSTTRPLHVANKEDNGHFSHAPVTDWYLGEAVPAQNIIGEP